MGNNRS